MYRINFYDIHLKYNHVSGCVIKLTAINNVLLQLVTSMNSNCVKVYGLKLEIYCEIV